MVVETGRRQWALGNERRQYSLVHPVGSGHEPVDDLLVVDGKEDDAGEGDRKRDVVPCPAYIELSRAGKREERRGLLCAERATPLPRGTNVSCLPQTQWKWAGGLMTAKRRS